MGKRVRRMHCQGPCCGWSTSLVVGRLFTNALSWLGAGGTLPMVQMPGPEIHHRMTEAKGFTGR